MQMKRTRAMTGLLAAAAVMAAATVVAPALAQASGAPRDLVWSPTTSAGKAPGAAGVTLHGAGAFAARGVPPGSELGATAQYGTRRGDNSELAFWVLKNVGGGIISGAAGKGFTEILSLLIGDKTSAQLDQINGKLDEIKVQLNQLQKTMDAALQEINKTHQDVLAQRLIDLRDSVLGAEGDFLEAMSYAGKPDKQNIVKVLVDNVTRAVDAPRTGLTYNFATVPEAIMPSSFTSTPFYHVLSNVVTGGKRFFTWRDSAGLDDVFHYLLDLQSLQFNLIAQVRTMEGSSPENIYQRFLQPYVGDQASFQAFVDGKVPAPTGGSLHDELATELTPVPQGAVVDGKTNSVWAVDAPGAAGLWGLGPSGPGYPTCTTKLAEPWAPVWVWCLTKPSAKPGTIETGTFDCCTVASKVESMANHLEKTGYGKAADWKLPTMGDFRALVAGSSGTPKSWLESQSGVDPTTCKQAAVGHKKCSRIHRPVYGRYTVTGLQHGRSSPIRPILAFVPSRCGTTYSASGSTISTPRRKGDKERASVTSIPRRPTRPTLATTSTPASETGPTPKGVAET